MENKIMIRKSQIISLRVQNKRQKHFFTKFVILEKDVIDIKTGKNMIEKMNVEKRMRRIKFIKRKMKTKIESVSIIMDEKR